MFHRMGHYLFRIYSSRYFWWNLALADLRFKYRRSYFGVLWSIFQPLAMTLLLSFVMGRMFKMEMHYFAPYIFSGMIMWELMLASVMAGCTTLVNSGAYIHLFNHPMAIYSLRSVLALFVNFLYAMIGLILWCVIAMPWKITPSPARIAAPGEYAWISFIVLPVSCFILFTWCWAGATICSFSGVRFHDLPQFLVLLMQALWFVSPVYFPLDLFRNGKMTFLLDYNPVYHILELFRAPLLDGNFPASVHWEWSIWTMIILWGLAIFSISTLERKTIYYV